MTGQDLDSTLLCSKTWEQSVVEFTQRTKYTVIYSFSQESYCYAVCKQKVKVKSLSRVRLFANPWTVAYQAPPSMGFSRQKYWSGLPFLSPFNSVPDSERNGQLCSHSSHQLCLLCPRGSSPAILGLASQLCPV